MIDAVAFRILQHCRDDLRPITSLIDKSTSRSALYRCKGNLCENGLLETDGKDRYRATEQGIQELQSALGEVPEGLATIYPPLKLVPTAYHLAAIELAIAAVIARKLDLRPDRHPAIILAGPTLKWKTSAGIFVCHMIGLDPSAHIVNLTAEHAKSLWLRKTSTGGISYKRNLLDAPIVVFDELQNADAECKRLLKIWMDGRKVLLLENEKLTLQATPLITLNPSRGRTLEERVGLERAQIRRCIIADLTNIEIANLAIRGEEIVKAAESQGPLALPKPQSDCASFKAQIFEVLRKTLNETGRDLVDLETLVMLSTAMTAFLGPVEAIRRVLYDSHLLYQTLEWTLPAWQLQVANFPRTAPRGTTAGTAQPSNFEVSDQKWNEAFSHLDSGGSTTQLVTKLEIPFEEANKIAKKYAELKSLDQKIGVREIVTEDRDDDVQRLEREVRIAELTRKKRELLGPLEAESMLAALRASLDGSGMWKQRHCSHMANNYCMYWLWEQKPNIPDQVGEPLLKDGKWYIQPTYPRCAVCSAYHKQDTATINDLELRLSNVEKATTRRDNAIKTLKITFDVLGSGKKQFCSYLQNNYCILWHWNQRPDAALMVGQPLLKGTIWHIQPTNTFCALCSSYCGKS
jgi:hypothetical protein